MMGRSWRWFVFGSFLAASCGTGADDVGTVQAALTASSTPTATGLPVGTTMTPNGPVDSTCVFEVPTGAVVEKGGDVIMNGVAIDHHRPCTPQQMGLLANGTTTSSSSPPSIYHDWIESINANAVPINGVASYNDLSGYWTVPKDPNYQCIGSACYDDPPLLYFFPAFQSSNEIVQPVLSWGYTGPYGGPYWSLSSWYVGPGGAYYSPPLRAYAGDTIFGVISILTPNEYQITTTNVTQGYYTYLNTYFYSPMNRVNGGALEVYHIWSCNAYPTSTPITFYNLSIFQSGPSWNSYNLVNPNWSKAVDYGANPQCTYGAFFSVDFNNNVSSAILRYAD